MHRSCQELGDLVCCLASEWLWSLLSLREQRGWGGGRTLAFSPFLEDQVGCWDDGVLCPPP